MKIFTIIFGQNWIKLFIANIQNFIKYSNIIDKTIKYDL